MAVRLRVLLLASLALASGCVGSGGDATPAQERIDSMAALGDSISMAANLDPSRFGDNPGHSWTTGGVPDDNVTSHHERLQDEVGDRTVNLGRSGARMRDLARQADRAVEFGARYVTILMGSNDACADSVSRMTSVDAFRSQFRDAAKRLDEGLPEGALVYVVSIPDVGQLRDLFWDSSEARGVWRLFNVCQALLRESATEEDVAAFHERLVDYNKVLREESGTFGFRFDGEAVFRREIRAEDVSTLDFFHPSLAGQARLAEVTWEAGPLSRGLPGLLD